MASPQPENGFTRIANEILDRLAHTKLSGREWQALMALFRQTYGFHKKQDVISLSQWEKLTGLSRRHIAAILRRLEARNIITVQRSQHGNTYAFQKNYDGWTSTENGTSTGIGTSTENGTKTSTENGTHKRKKKVASADKKTSAQVPPQRQRKKRQPKEPCPQPWMIALHSLCGVDISLSSPGFKKRASAAGKALVKVGAQVGQVDTFQRKWYADDWRGKQGDAPTPEQVRDNWAKYVPKPKPPPEEYEVVPMQDMTR